MSYLLVKARELEVFNWAVENGLYSKAAMNCDGVYLEGVHLYLINRDCPHIKITGRKLE